HGPRVAVAENVDQFVAALRAALQPSTEEERQARIEVARQNSWHARIVRMSGIIADRLEVRRGQRDPWEAKLRHFYRRTRGRVIGTASAVALIYFLFFYTSLPWVLAEPLRIDQPPSRADAVVVFAGGVGESGQAGGGYQERVATAVDLYRRGFAPVMVFESGYTFTFQEAEMMRDLAVSQGVALPAIV